MTTRIGLLALVFAFAIGCSDDGSAAGGHGGSSTSTGTPPQGGDAPTCTPGETETCYDGPQATAHVGACADGARTCGADGTFGACEGQVLPALVDDCTQMGDEDCDGIFCSELVWSATYPTIGESPPQALAFTPGGDVLLAGLFRGELDFGSGIFIGFDDPAIYTAEVIETRDIPWSEADTLGTDAIPFGLASSASGAFAYAGGFRGSMFIGGGLTSAGDDDVLVYARESDGTITWAKAFGDAASQRARWLAFDANGGLIVTGVFTGTLDFGDGVSVSKSGTDLDVFVVKLDALTGEAQWATSFGDTTLTDDAPLLAVASNGDVLLAGSFQGSMSLVTANLTAPADRDVYVVKLDGDGGEQWAVSFAGSGDQRADAVGGAPNGDVLIAGTMFGSLEIGETLVVPDASSDAFAAVLDPNGGVALASRFDDEGDTSVLAGAVDAQGGLVFTGLFAESVDFGGGPLVSSGASAPYVAKLDVALAHRWSKTFPVDGALTPTALAVDRNGDGAVAVAGSLTGSVDFGDGPLTSDAGATVQVSAALFQP